MTQLETSTTVTGLDPASVLDAMLEHLEEHDLAAVRQDDAWVIEYDEARITLRTENSALHAHIAASDPESLYDARMLVFYHIVEFSACPPEAIQWDGHALQLERPPAFRLLTVESVTDLSPHMRRVRFLNPELARYQRDDDIHCKLILPPLGLKNPEWPTLAPDGTPQFPTGEKKLDIRTYTIRRIDAGRGWMDIDFVLHEDAGPGAAWAAQAAPGQQIGVSGPGGRTARPADWMLLAGDDTALPAIARIGETLPDHTEGVVIIEVADAASETPLKLPAGMTLRWLHRHAHAPATGSAAATAASLATSVSPPPTANPTASAAATPSTGLLETAIRSCRIPDVPDRFFWVAAEFDTAQAVRAWLRGTMGVAGKDQLVVAYWRRGMDETRMKSGGRTEKPALPEDAPADAAPPYAAAPHAPPAHAAPPQDAPRPDAPSAGAGE